MNIYRYKFYAKCPNNGQIIEYWFELTTGRMIPVEDIVGYCKKFSETFHEKAADDLMAQFGGAQRLVAFHHGVEIETRRGRF
jgi:hypothetical protein